jgi:hypothetical protein
VKAKVLKPFKDKYSGKLHEKGATIIISRERYQEILTRGPLVEEVKGKPKTAAD